MDLHEICLCSICVSPLIYSTFIIGWRFVTPIQVCMWTHIALGKITTWKTVCSNGIIFFVGAAGDGAAPTVACSGAQRPATPTNRTAGAAGDTSHPYKWVWFIGAAHSPAAPGVSICRGSWWLNRPYKCPMYNYMPFVGAAQSPAAPTNDPHIKKLQHLLPPQVTRSNLWKKGGKALGTS